MEWGIITGHQLVGLTEMKTRNAQSHIFQLSVKSTSSHSTHSGTHKTLPVVSLLLCLS